MAFMTAAQLSTQYQSVLKPANKPEHEVSQVTSTEDRYEVKLSINQFEPEELSVKVVDRYIHIEGRHEEKNDKIGFFTRTFTRRYFLPEGVQPESIRCTFHVDTSILTVNAPIINKKPVKELTIPIIVVGQQPVYSQPNKEKRVKESDGKSELKGHHHHHPKQHQHQQHPQQPRQGMKDTQQQPPIPAHKSATLPPPAIASTSRRHHHNNHHHHQEKQLHHHHHHTMEYPPSQMNF